eukprot:scaffold1280_cov19-Tisochrysis_lutea.AAC.1
MFFVVAKRGTHAARLFMQVSLVELKEALDQDSDIEKADRSPAFLLTQAVLDVQRWVSAHMVFNYADQDTTWRQSSYSTYLDVARSFCTFAGALQAQEL